MLRLRNSPLHGNEIVPERLIHQKNTKIEQVLLQRKISRFHAIVCVINK